MKKSIVTLFGSFFYSGFAPFAPASFACFVWTLLYLFVPGGARLASPVALACMIPVSIYLCRVMERYYGEDASCIVIDEFVGMQVTMLAIVPSLEIAAAGFVLFRIFDIVKLPPARAAERIGGGVGVVLDDVVAGIYSRLVLLILMRFIPLD